MPVPDPAVAVAPTPAPQVGTTTATSTPIPPTETSIPWRTPEPTPFVGAPAEPFIPDPPDRDLQDLGRRLVKGYVEPESIVPSPPLTVGEKVDFWVSRDNGSVIVNGEVSNISENAYWIFELGFQPDPDDIASVVDQFETDIWPVITDVFGRPLTPGIDGDDRIVIYTAVLRTGVAGYFSAADSYSSEIRVHSNQREALYMSADRIDLTSREYLSVVAHELQHATHFATDPSEDSWVNEGLSEVAAELAGFARSATSAFVLAPATSLTAWAQDISISTANYGAANLFFAFLATHYGGNEILTTVAREQKDGIASVDASLASMGFAETANDVYADWLVANYLSTDEGPYRYDGHDVPPVKTLYRRAPDSRTSNVRSYGAEYLVTSTGSGRMAVSFQGESETALLNNPPHSGDTCWWANQGDSIDSTLTRSVDLRSVESATLKFWVDYEIEEFWDYAYVMASINNGSTWDILESRRGLNFNPNGNAYGPGLTGTSLGWVQDSVDLSAYAGNEILLRFEYITDDAVFSKGPCFDDFEIEEIGWSDDTSNDGDWVAEGFVRVRETIPTQYLIQLIHEKDVGEPVVYQMPIDITGKGEFTVENVGDDDLVVVVISAVTRASTLPTEYTVTLRE
tara:strand:- start:45 stop:1928 length:1884 start_codon:yes stop_codon:yes gene_type:complete